jgi:hypothetical protein
LRSDDSGWQEHGLLDQIKRFGIPITVFELDRAGNEPPAGRRAHVAPLAHDVPRITPLDAVVGLAGLLLVVALLVSG